MWNRRLHAIRAAGAAPATTVATPDGPTTVATRALDGRGSVGGTRDAIEWRSGIGDEALELTPTLRAGESTMLTLEAKAIEGKGERFEQVFGLKPMLSSGAIARATDA